MSSNRPSVNWQGFDDLEPGPFLDRIKTVLSTVNFRQLEKVALLARAQHDKREDPDLTCTANTSLFAYGYNNLVLELAFSDHVYWIARIRYRVVGVSEARGHAMDLLSEIATIRTVRERTSIPAPQVFAFDVSPSNEVGCPYMIMEALPGRTLGGSIAAQVPSEHLPKVASQLAEVVYQLYGLAFDRAGRLWRGKDGDGPLEVIPVDAKPCPRTSLGWFYRQRQRDNRRAMKNHPDDPEWRAACWVLKTAVAHIIIEARARGPFPLCHPDIHAGNLLFDDDYNLTGVVDWAQAQTVPLERLVVTPEILTSPDDPEERNNSVEVLKTLIRDHLQRLELAGRAADASSPLVLSSYFGSKRAEITHRCTYTHFSRALWNGQRVASLIFGDAVAWEQLVRAYGETELT